MGGFQERKNQRTNPFTLLLRRKSANPHESPVYLVVTSAQRFFLTDSPVAVPVLEEQCDRLALERLPFQHGAQRRPFEHALHFISYEQVVILWSKQSLLFVCKAPFVSVVPQEDESSKGCTSMSSYANADGQLRSPLPARVTNVGLELPLHTSNHYGFDVLSGRSSTWERCMAEDVSCHRFLFRCFLPPTGNSSSCLDWTKLIQSNLCLNQRPNPKNKFAGTFWKGRWAFFPSPLYHLLGGGCIFLICIQAYQASSLHLLGICRLSVLLLCLSAAGKTWSFAVMRESGNLLILKQEYWRGFGTKGDAFARP